MQKLIKFNEVTKENVTEHHPSWIIIHEFLIIHTEC